MSAVVMVPFAGEGSGVGRLTWGQSEIWQAMQCADSSLCLGGAMELPADSGLDEAAAVLRFLVERHHSLRTRLAFDPGGGVRQAVAASGEVPLEIVDVPPGQEPGAVAEAVRERYLSTKFDYEHEWPIRMAVVRRDGVLTHAVSIYCHLALDVHGLGALLSDLLANNPTGAAQPGPAAGIQPMDLARQQREPAARRRSDAALRYWEQTVRAAPSPMFRPAAVPANQNPHSSHDSYGSPYRPLQYRSPAAKSAMLAIAARLGTDTGPVLLAAYAVTIARLTGVEPVVVMTLVSNRFRPGFADSVSPLTQKAPCVVEVADSTFDEVVWRAQNASLRASMYGYYDPDRREALLESISRERGTEIDLSCFYNDRRAPDRPEPPRTAVSPDELSALLPLSSAAWGTRGPAQDHKFMLHIDETPDALDCLICADTRFVTPSELERSARVFESVLVGAATGTDSKTRASSRAQPA